MILGNYPCCGDALTIAMPEKSGVYAREECPHCGTPVWHFLSRVQSQSWTETDFLKEHTVDPVNKTIRANTPQPPLSDAAQMIMDMAARLAAKQVAEEIIGKPKGDQAET